MKEKIMANANSRTVSWEDFIDDKQNHAVGTKCRSPRGDRYEVMEHGFVRVNGVTDLSGGGAPWPDWTGALAAARRRRQ